MKTWLQDNIIQMLVILVSITFGYAHFTARISSTAEAQSELKSDIKDYKKETNDKLDRLIKLTERIDERTSKR